MDCEPSLTARPATHAQRRVARFLPWCLLLVSGCGTLHMEEASTVVVRTAWVPPAEGVVVVEEQATGFIVEGGLAAEVRGETGWGIHLTAEERADLDWRAELASAGPPSGGATATSPGASVSAGAPVSRGARVSPGARGSLGTPSVDARRVGTAWSGADADGSEPLETPSIAGRGRVEFERPAPHPREGVWSLDGGATSLGALVDGGVQIDGVRVDLSELEALARLDLAGGVSTRLATDAALEAFAELEHDTLPRSGGPTQVVVRLRGAAAPTAQRGPVRVHLVLDRSSSMQRTWPRVIASARALISRLRPRDQLQIVAYGTDVVEAFPLGPVGDGDAARAALGGIVVGGGTHIEGGLSMAYQAAARASGEARGLVLLLSDGVPNHGSFDPSELSGLAGRARRQSGCTTSVVGLGTQFDAGLLRSIATAGRGGYHVAVNIDGLGEELEGELDAYARAAARDVTVSVRLSPGMEVVGGGPFRATADGAQLSLPQLVAGEERRVVLPVRVAASVSAGAVAWVNVRYQSRLSAGWVSADRALSVSRGTEARRAGLAFQTRLDRSLGRALDQAAAAVAQGDGRGAAQALRSHVQMVEGRIEYTRAPLQTRVRVVTRAARALEALTPTASHGLRRRVSVSLGEIAARISR
ncbi:MAG: VWA domain-containing protein [Sandaracinaceae bacterium]